MHLALERTSWLVNTEFKGHEFCLHINCTCREPLHHSTLQPEAMITVFLEYITSSPCRML